MARKNNANHTKAGLGLAAVAAATAAGAYFLYGSKHAAKNRKKVKGWALKAKGEVLHRMENAKSDITEIDYKGIVDSVVERYKKLKDVNLTEVEALRNELKSHWKNIAKEMKAPGVKKAVKKSARKVKKS